jgi:hypothetical protein
VSTRVNVSLARFSDAFSLLLTVHDSSDDVTEGKLDLVSGCAAQ